MNPDRSRAAGLLLVLALAGALIAFVNTFGVTDPQRALGFAGAAFGLVGIGFLLGAGIDLSISRGQPSGPTPERDLILMAFGFAFGIAGTALIPAAVGMTATAYLVLAVGMAWVLVWLPVSIRTDVAVCKIVVSRDPASVFAYVSDKCNLVHWFPGYMSVEKITPGPIASGSRFQCQIQLHGRTIQGVEEIVDFEPPVFFTSRAVAARPNMDLTRCEAVGGQTQVTHRYQGVIAYSAALFGAATHKTKTRSAILAINVTAFARLKQVLEGEPAGPSG